MSRTLLLTSPHMTGDDVRAAQQVLNGQNILGQDFYAGTIDGDYGELSAQAAYRAHYWLGFSLAELAKLGHRYGDVVRGLLTGSIDLDAKRAKLRDARTKASLEEPLRSKAYRLLEQHVGDVEHPPFSNHSYATAWYGMVGPWCAMAVTEAYVLAGSKAFAKGQRYAYVPFLEYDARMGRNQLALTRAPQRGDLVCFDWDDDGVSDHVELFGSWADEAAGVMNTIGANTTSGEAGDQSDGGGVYRRQRRLSDVSFRHTSIPAFVHCGG